MGMEEKMNYSLKAEIDNCFMYADAVDNEGYGAGTAKGIRMREMFRFTMQQSGIFLKSKTQFFLAKPIWTNLQWVHLAKHLALAELRTLTT